MSCDENKKAHARDKASRSLPILQDLPQDQPAPHAAGGRRLWRSIEELRGSEALHAAAQREFPPGASELTDGVSRRSFMQLLGTSAALAGVGAACRKPNEKIVPFVRRPDEVTPGNALHFATGFALEGFASGLLVESHEGRPTKIEGNPQHPVSQGKATAVEQGLVQSLYDDDRARQLSRKGDPIAWRTLVADITARAAKLAANGGAGLRFLAEPTASPLLADLRRRLTEKFPKAKFVSYAAGTAGDAAAEGARLSFGKPLQIRHDLSQAAVILALDADIIGDGPEQLSMARAFAAGRDPGPNMNRLYVVEPALTITGSVADHRLRVRGSDVAAVAVALIAELARGIGSLAPLAALAQKVGGRTGRAADTRWIAALAKDLEKNRGRCVVVAGRRQPAAVHALVNALNHALDNVGKSVSWSEPLLADTASGPAALGGLVGDIAAGQVDTLVITARNPAYTAPVDFRLAELLPRIPYTLYHTLYQDETAAACHVIVPATHPLESWGDGRAVDGTVSIVQPLIAPIWGGIQEAEVLAAFLGEAEAGAHELLRSYWREKGPIAAKGVEQFDNHWEQWLADGIVPDTAAKATGGATVDAGALAGALGPLLAPKAEGMEIGFALDSKVFDGRFANNAWMQELPDGITKLTWDNAVLVSPATAAQLGVDTGDMVKVTYRERTLVAPAMIQPGHADDAFTLPLGYGRTGASESVARDIGFNAGQLRTSEAPWYDRGAALQKWGEGYKFGITQDHWSMSPDGREIPPPAVETTLAALLNERSEFHQEVEERRGPVATIMKPVDYSQQAYKWAMALDLNKCTGCNACVVACQAENNIPVVGKANVMKGREMHWIRIDRYFVGELDQPDVLMQPVACVHCETAPCEYVCPVNATVHSDEGLNEMVYNRCIGTRYCSNNCPYKVRRFNFLAYTAETPGARTLQMNPDVTVRSRGVMEKCTYCVQRIERKRIDTRIEGRTIADGELQTACEQTCPSKAITFGSLNDPQSRVTRLHADGRRYDLLHEIGTRPRTAYLARVRNPNPELARAE
jgi:molybdopterin-containing oxidoreductase family iron-sulfur binding subunit